MSDAWIYTPEQNLLPATLLGGKAVNLGELARLGQPVPPFYAVTTAAFRHALDEAGLTERIAARVRAAGDEAEIAAAIAEVRGWIEAVALPPALAEALDAAYASAGFEGEAVAVRSSAADEDASGQSFAGMHDSFLYERSASAVRDAVRRVWASAYNDRAFAYRKSQGLALEDLAVAVVVQRMVDATRSGVMFTCSPTTGDVHQVVVSSLYGAGEGLVSAGLDADTFSVDKETRVITPTLATKEEQLLANPAGAGLTRSDVPAERREAPSLTDEEIGTVVAAGLRIERHFRRPQDVEFCFDGEGAFSVVQSRPVTKVDEYGPAAGHRVVWDNSNIIESYSGVTSPMTFSFIRRAYTIVYHCFADVMGIRPKVVKAHQRTFENMLGLFRGRVFYNLKSWYQVVRLFPGFQYNSRFMESMMGLKEPLELEDESAPPGFLRRWFVELPALLRLLLRSSWNFMRIRRITADFQAGFQEHYARWEGRDFARMSPNELKALYDEMEDALLWNWKAPIINDFYVMIYYGILKKLCGSWGGDETGALQNDLLAGEGGVESAEPARFLLRLAQTAQGQPELRRLIVEEPLEELPRRVKDDPAFVDFQARMQEYLDLYGFRCMNELKLEEFSLRDRPHLVYQVLRNYLVLDDPAALDVKAMEKREQLLRHNAEAKAFAGLRETGGILPRRAIFRRVMRNARLGVKNRENMRFARTRIYGLVRELLRGLADGFVREGILDDREDVFYLTIGEVWDYVQGTAACTDLRGLAAVRRREFDGYRAGDAPVPDDRFDTYGMAYHKNAFRNRRAAEPVAEDGVLRGTGVSPGVVVNDVRVLASPDDDMSLNREILVAERTDPGWVPLYPAVSGILIERGSVLSHSAVVAREMGIPTIVGITGLLGFVADGDRVRMDGVAGTVELEDDAADDDG